MFGQWIGFVKKECPGANGRSAASRRGMGVGEQGARGAPLCPVHHSKLPAPVWGSEHTHGFSAHLNAMSVVKKPGAGVRREGRNADLFVTAHDR